MISAINGTRLPKRSASMPKMIAPTGRIASVTVMVSATIATVCLKSSAIWETTKLTIKKSKASSVQPRKLARNVLRWLRLRDRMRPIALIVCLSFREWNKTYACRTTMKNTTRVPCDVVVPTFATMTLHGTGKIFLWIARDVPVIRLTQVKNKENKPHNCTACSLYSLVMWNADQDNHQFLQRFAYLRYTALNNRHQPVRYILHEIIGGTMSLKRGLIGILLIQKEMLWVTG